MIPAADTRLAEVAVRAARRRKLVVPLAIEDAAAMWQVIVDASHTPQPDRLTADHVPDTPDQLAKLIAERAEAKRRVDSVRAVAGDFRDPIVSRYNQLVQAQVPAWIRALQPEFLALTKALTAQAKKLPADLRVQVLDWNDPKVSAAWEKAESVAHQLDQLVKDRQDMARAVGGDTGRDSDLYAVALLPEPTVDDVFADTLRDVVGPVLRGWRDLRQQPVSRWLHLARSECVTLRLADPGEVTQRAAAMDRWRDAIAARHMATSRSAAVAAVRHALVG